MNDYIHTLQVQNEDFYIGLNENMVADGLTVDENGKVKANIGKGLGFNNGKIVVTAQTSNDNTTNNGITNLSDYVGNGLKYENDEILVKASNGITVNSNGVGVNIGDGLKFNEDGAITVTAQTSDSSSIDTEELIKRIQGNSENTNSAKDSFEYLGDYEIKKGEGVDTFNPMLDVLTYGNETVGNRNGKGIGYFRARLNYRELEIINILMSTGQTTSCQVVKGMLRIDENGSLTVWDSGYKIIHRTRTNGGKWTPWVEIGTQSDWDNNDVNSPSYIKNKPTLVNAITLNGNTYSAKTNGTIDLGTIISNGDVDLSDYVTKDMMPEYEGDGIYFNDGDDGKDVGFTINCGEGLSINETTKALQVNIGKGLAFDEETNAITATGSGDVDLSDYVQSILIEDSLELYPENGVLDMIGVFGDVRKDELSYYCGDGLYFDDEKFKINCSSGLSIDTSNKLQVNIGRGLALDPPSNEIHVKISEGITQNIEDGYGISVNTGNGLEILNGKVSVKLGEGLTFDGDGAITTIKEEFSPSIPNGNNDSITEFETDKDGHVIVTLMKGKNIIKNKVSQLTVTSLTKHDSSYVEYQLSFKTSEIGCTIGYGMENLLWANGIVPSTSLTPNTYYELNIDAVTIDDETVYRAVLTAFN